MNGLPRISNVYNMANGEPPKGDEAERRNQEARAALWHKLGVAVIDPEDVNHEWERQSIIATADRLYGRRRGKA